MSLRRNSTTAKSFRASLKRSPESDINTHSNNSDLTSKVSNWSFINGQWKLTYEDGVEVSLLHTKHEPYSMQDFSSEIRPSADIYHFISSPALILDLNESSLDEILQCMLMKILEINKVNLKDASLLKSIFTLDNGCNLLSQTICGMHSQDQYWELDQSWLVILGTSALIEKRGVAICRLKVPVNFGDLVIHNVRFVTLVLSPFKEKSTKTGLQIGLTFATLFADIDFRQKLLAVETEEDFCQVLLNHTKAVVKEQTHSVKNYDNEFKNANSVDELLPKDDSLKGCRFMGGLREDFTRRLKFYVSDYVDGIRGPKTPQKLLSTVFFLYFACLLPSIAFGSLNGKNTLGKINVEKVILGQGIGGIVFALFGGQPLLILLTTAPLALYTKTVFEISRLFDVEFFAMFACVGLWNSFFLICYSIFGASKIMKWCTRSTEEIFALFITVAFFVDAFTRVDEDFKKNYYNDGCTLNSSILQDDSTSHKSFFNSTGINTGPIESGDLFPNCNRESSILYLFLMFGTLWLGLTLYNFTKTPYLGPTKREILSDYSLPIAVIVVSAVGSFVFRDVNLSRFHYEESTLFSIAPLHLLSVGAVFAGMGLGFCLSVLFFMDQNISAAMVNTPSNKLKKGTAYHFDLLVVAIINGFLSIFSLPWMHAAIPHCPLHVRCLADFEEMVQQQGSVYHVIVRVRETRLSALIAHILIGLSLLLLPYPLMYIPDAVLDGLFLYVAVTGLYGNQFFERILLLFTEQAAYPLNHYIRRVPQRKIHFFTLIQLVQLGIMCLFGFFPLAYLQMSFPLILFLLIPIRFLLTTRLISSDFLKSLDDE